MMIDLKTALQYDSSNIIAIDSQKRTRKKSLEKLLLDNPKGNDGIYENSDDIFERRIVMAFEHMDQEQAQEFYMKVSEKVGSRGKELLSECLKCLLRYNSSILPQIEKIAVDILSNDDSKQNFEG